MATAWGIVQARDPKAADVSSLVNAMTYKQQQYDANVVKVQGMIEQYLNTDILRDVDKEYFQQRLGTLVDYINQSGTRDWSRNNIVMDVSGHLSQVLDENTMSAISSTKALRKQQEEIAKIKEKNPELYAIQNEAHAMMDLPRYMNSKKVGDRYRPLEYTPYTDVNKQVLEYTKIMKDHGIEYVTDVSNVDGEGWFRKIDTYEVLSPEKVRQTLGVAFDQKVLGQLSIDGWYKYRGYSDEQLQKEYKDYVGTKASAIQERIDALVAGESKDIPVSDAEKKERQATINSLKEQKKSIESIDVSKVDRNALASQLHTDMFVDKWTGVLSYQRLKDSKIDDTVFKIHKQKRDEMEADRDYALRLRKQEFDEANAKNGGGGSGSDKDGSDKDGGAGGGLFTPTEDSALPNAKETTYDELSKKYSEARDKAIANADAYFSVDANLQAYNKKFGTNYSKEQLMSSLKNTTARRGAMNSQLENVIGKDVFAEMNGYRYQMGTYEKRAKKFVNDEADKIISNVRNVYTGAGSLESTFNGGALDSNGKITRDVSKWENSGKFTEVNKLIASINAQNEAGVLENQGLRRKVIENRMRELGVDNSTINQIMTNHVVGGSRYKEGGFYRNPVKKVASKVWEWAVDAMVHHGSDTGGKAGYYDKTQGMQSHTANFNTSVKTVNAELNQLTPRNKVVTVNTNHKGFSDWAYPLLESFTQRDRNGNLQNFEFVKGGNVRIRRKNDGSFELEADVKAVGSKDDTAVTRTIELSSSYIPADLRDTMISNTSNIYSANNPIAAPISRTSRMVSNREELNNLHKHKTAAEQTAIREMYMSSAADPSSPYFLGESKIRQQQNLFSTLLSSIPNGKSYANEVDNKIKSIVNDRYTVKTEDGGDVWLVNVYDSKGNAVATVSQIKSYSPSQFEEDTQLYIGTAINKRLAELQTEYLSYGL